MPLPYFHVMTIFFQRAVDASTADLVKHLKLLEDTEKGAVRRVLTEERARYCTFVSCLKPVLDEEISMMTEFQQLEEINKKLTKHTDDPFKLPAASEQVNPCLRTLAAIFTKTWVHYKSRHANLTEFDSFTF